MLGDSLHILFLVLQLLSQIERDVADTNHPIFGTNHNQIQRQLVPQLATVLKLQIFVDRQIQDFGGDVHLMGHLALSAFDDEVELAVRERTFGVELADVYILSRHTYN